MVVRAIPMSNCANDHVEVHESLCARLLNAASQACFAIAGDGGKRPAEAGGAREEHRQHKPGVHHRAAHLLPRQ